MTEWIATTKSGRTYESVEGGIRVSGEGYFPQPVIRSISDANQIVTLDNRIDWDKLNALPAVARPVVGEYLYISTVGDAGWRISTRIVSVEDVER